MGIGMEASAVSAEVVLRSGQSGRAMGCPEVALMRAWCQSDKRVMKSRRRALRLLSSIGVRTHLALRLDA